MKLNEAGSAVMHEMTKTAGDVEGAALGGLLDRLPKEICLDIDQAVGDYVAAVLEAGFLAGLEVGRNPLSVLTQGAGLHSD